MHLFKSETFAPTPLAIGLALGTVLLALLLSQPDAARFVFGLPHSLAQLDTDSFADASGRFLVDNPLTLLVLVIAIGGAVAYERSLQRRAGR